MATQFSGWFVSLICILVLVACDVRPFSYFDDDNDDDEPWEHETISLSSGGAFHPALAGMPVTLTFGEFDGPIGRFRLEQDSIVQTGDVIISGDVCTFFVTSSSCPRYAGGQRETTSIVFCEVDSDGRLLIIVPAQPAELAHRTFTCPDGKAFGIAERNLQLDFDRFGWNTGTFTLSSGDLLAPGVVTVRDSCEFEVDESDFSPEPSPRDSTPIIFDPCEVDTVSGRLFAEDVDTRMNLICHLLTK